MYMTERTPIVGDTAPDFTLPALSQSSEPAEQQFQLSKQFGGKTKGVVLFFYPKDNTPGCTKEAIGFTEHLAAFEAAGIKVVGMSPDPIKKHVKFKDKHSLEVILVSDEEKTALEAYSVWIEKSMYGRKYMGVERSTFLIDGNLKIVNAWRKVKVAGHVEEVLAAAKVLSSK